MTETEQVRPDGKEAGLQVIDGFHDLSDDDALDALREILVDRYRQRLEGLQAEVDQVQDLLDKLEIQVNDKDALITTLTPVMSDAIRTSIRDSRDEMVDALYPIMGKLVGRAVSEAMRDLARSIDEQMRNAFGIASLKRQVLARTSGVSSADLLIRSSLPFRAQDIFLIHRESGLLICHVAGEAGALTDTDIISGMLTALRDFVQDAFQHRSEGDLETIQYGRLQILLEAGRYCYIAAVVHGVEPAGYREQVRDALHTISNEHFKALKQYAGDASQLAGVDQMLTPLLAKVGGESVVDLRTNPVRAWRRLLQRTLLWSAIVLVLLLIAWRLWQFLGA